MSRFTFKKLLGKIDNLDKALILVFVLGVGVAILSLCRGILIDRQVQVEYISSDETTKEQKIFVDIGGAVINPGVYELAVGSRLKDALVAAGGMSGNADRDYSEKNINLAEIIKDGEKIYIPFKGAAQVEGSTVNANESKKINVNIATQAQLDTLLGVGPSRIDSIVKNRPYKNLEELVSKGALTKSILEKNREVLSVY